MESLYSKYESLQAIIRAAGRMAIAFSGGVDSTLLLRAAVDTLGADAVPFFASSVLQPQKEREAAQTLAEEIGVKLNEFEVFPMGWPEFAANPVDRCYHCKWRIYNLFLREARERDFSILADGTNLDDLGQDRPGLKAIRELGVVTPLATAGLTKKEIREISSELGLVTWNKPSASCLATRIASGQRITLKLLLLVEKIEGYLHGHGFFGCRARLDRGRVFVELTGGGIERLVHEGIKEELLTFLEDLQVKKVYLDLAERKENHV